MKNQTTISSLCKLLIILFYLQTNIYADFIDAYKNGNYHNVSDKIYVLDSISIKKKNYKQELKSALHVEVASQIYSQVSSTTNSSYTSEKRDTKEMYSESFSQNNTMVTEDIPLYGLKYINEKVVDDYYFVLVEFDFKKVLPIYLKANEELVQKIDELYIDSLKEVKLYKKEALLQKTLSLYKQHEKHLRVLSLISPNTEPLEAKVTFAKVEGELLRVMDGTAQNTEDLVRILVKRLGIKSLHNSIYIEPISLRDNHIYSEFSYEFKNYLSNYLQNLVTISSNEDSYYTLKGYYHIEGNKVIVNIFILNRDKKIVSSSMAQTKITEKEKLLKKYKPLHKETQNSLILDEYLHSW